VWSGEPGSTHDQGQSSQRDQRDAVCFPTPHLKYLRLGQNLVSADQRWDRKQVGIDVGELHIVPDPMPFEAFADIARRPQQDHRLRAGAHNYGQQPDAATELVKCLALPSSVPVIKNNGMDPA
jgi:hypothetical protein